MGTHRRNLPSSDEGSRSRAFNRKQLLVAPRNLKGPIQFSKTQYSANCSYIISGLWNFIISLITPYMVDKDKGNLGAKVFYIWGSLCATAFVFAWFLIPETKGLTLEQVDKMLEETTPRMSAKWRHHDTHAAEMGRARTPVPKTPDGSVDEADGQAEKASESQYVRVL